MAATPAIACSGLLNIYQNEVVVSVTYSVSAVKLYDFISPLKLTALSRPPRLKHALSKFGIIFFLVFACTDAGLTGRSLSLVSKRFHGIFIFYFFLVPKSIAEPPT